MSSFPITSFPSIGASDYSQIQNIINTGDILLASGESFIDKMIQGATNSVWSHVAFLVKVDELNTIMVMESVETVGVRATPLLNYVQNYNGSGKGFNGKLMLARYQNFPLNNIAMLTKAVSLLGNPYNTQEILKIAVRIGYGSFGFTKNDPQIQSSNALICSEYVDICYQALGINIPYNNEGFIAPCDFANCSNITPICFINTGV